MNSSNLLLKGICHGIRNGYEVFEFRKNLKTKEIYGTDIHFNDKNNDDKFIKLDFHEEVPDWDYKFDFVYTNSLDHAHDPLRCIKSWCRSLQKNGIIIINFTDAHTPAAAGDPEYFSFKIKSLINLISNNMSNLKFIDLLDYDIPIKYKNDDLIKKWNYLILKKTSNYSYINWKVINNLNLYDSVFNKYIFDALGIKSLLIKSDIVAHQRYNWFINKSKNFHNLNILDLGSGNCFLSFFLLKKNNYVTSVSFDNFNNEKAFCRSKKLGFKNHKIIFSDFKNGYDLKQNNLYDKVILLETLEHIKEDEILLKSINNVMRLGGEFIISTPFINFKSLLKSDYYLNIGVGSHVRHGYSIEQLTKILKNSGFEITEYDYLTSNLINYLSQLLRFLALKKLSLFSTILKFILILPIKVLDKYKLKQGNYIALVAKKIVNQ